MYYRVAIQVDQLPRWQWRSTVLSSLDALLQLLRLYRAVPQDRLRVFSCSSREEMNEQFVQENQGLESTSVTAAQFLQERRITQQGALVLPLDMVDNSTSPGERISGSIFSHSTGQVG